MCLGLKYSANLILKFTLQVVVYGKKLKEGRKDGLNKDLKLKSSYMWSFNARNL